MPRSISIALALACAATITFAQDLPGVAQQRQSLFTQRDSLKRQMGDANFKAAVGTTFYGDLPNFYLAGYAPCPPLEPAVRETLISNAARSQSIDPGLLRAVMHRESGFHPCAVSVKGALGVMQLMPVTLTQFHVRDPFDPGESIRAGAALLRNLLDRYNGDLKLTLAAYNAGSARIDAATPDTYPDETRNYIAAILSDLAADEGSQNVTAAPASFAPGNPREACTNGSSSLCPRELRASGLGTP